MTEPALPSTLPKRTATNRVRLFCERDCKSISHTRFEAPITLLGFTALSVEISTNLFTPARSAASTRMRVPTMLLRIASRGITSSSGTCLCAAAWNTTCGRKRWNAISMPSASLMSATTACSGRSGYRAASSCCR